MRMRSMPPPPYPANATMLHEPQRHDAEKPARAARRPPPGLALLFMLGNSGGIVGLRGARRAGTRRAGFGFGFGFGLGLATLEILPQRRAQTALLAHLLRAL